ncbi:MAG: glutamine amidotransferase-related protein, partial [Planctomycetota bacterium]
RILHGKTSPIRHDGRGLFRGLPETFPAARYHSLMAIEIPDCFEVTARTADLDEPMAVRHREKPLFGLQFHPESFLTERGCDLLQNFLESAP